jgi:hypothetical protein
MGFYFNPIYIPLGICLGVVLLDHRVVLFLVFWGTSVLLSIVVVLIYFSNNTVWGFLFLPHLCQHLFVFLMIAIQTGVGGIFMWFWLAFPLWPGVLVICTFSFEKTLLFLHWVIDSLGVFCLFVWAPCYPGY